MRAISARAGELVRTLQQSASLLERLTRRTLDPAILAELEALGDVNALPHLVALALSAGTESRTRVASVAVATWRRASSASLISLDESYRVTWWTPGTDSAPWDRLRPADVADLARVDEDAWALLAVASFHASGHVREAAVRALDTIATGNELPFLIVRLNDWVDVVAERARDAVMRRVDATQANVWARNVPLIQRLAATSRRDHSDVIDAVYNVLRRPSSREALETLFASMIRQLVALRFVLLARARRDTSALRWLGGRYASAISSFASMPFAMHASRSTMRRSRRCSTRRWRTRSCRCGAAHCWRPSTVSRR